MVSNPLPGSVFQSLIHFAPDGFLVVDRAGMVVFANAQAEVLFGYSREELMGTPVERLIPERFRASHLDLRGRYSRVPRARSMGTGLALKARRRDGSEFDVEISLAPVYTDEGLLVSVTVRDVTEQRELEEERRRLLGATQIERERDRISADLHDGVMQTMYSVGLLLTNFLYETPTLTDGERGRIDDAIKELNQAIGDVRQYVSDLHPAEFNGDLRSSLDALVRLFTDSSTASFSFSGDLDTTHLEPAVAFELFLLAREALSNVQRHAEASSVVVVLDEEDDGLVLKVEDDGVGFDLANAPPGHFGLRNMRRRADALGAQLELLSSPGSGTVVCVHVPALPAT